MKAHKHDKAHKHVKAHTPPTTFPQIKREVAAEFDRKEPELFKKHAEMLILRKMVRTAHESFGSL